MPPRWLPVLLGLGWLAVAAGAVDVRARRLPDGLTLPALPVALLLLVPVGGSAVWRGVLGAAVAAAAHLLVHLAAPAALGAGDVKLSAPLGAALGAGSWEALVVARPQRRGCREVHDEVCRSGHRGPEHAPPDGGAADRNQEQ